MNKNKSNLLRIIEQRRTEMIVLSNSYGMNADVVILASKRLDHLLNKYQNGQRYLHIWK